MKSSDKEALAESYQDGIHKNREDMFGTRQTRENSGRRSKSNENKNKTDKSKPIESLFAAKRQESSGTNETMTQEKNDELEEEISSKPKDSIASILSAAIKKKNLSKDEVRKYLFIFVQSK